MMSIYEKGLKIVNSKAGILLGASCSLVLIFISVFCYLANRHRADILYQLSNFITLIIGIATLRTQVIRWNKLRRKNTESAR
jgi:hypothetical protein